jgi:pimeloyl-ACP methyl ester carboxylesterase
MQAAGLAFDRSGTGPAVVLLHGIGHDRRGWGPVTSLLMAHRDLIAVDLPGHGDSALPERGGPCGVRELTDQVQALLIALGLRQPVLVGNSLGAAIALKLSLRGRAGAVVALAPIGFWSPAETGYAVAVLQASRALARRLGPALPVLLRARTVRAAVLSPYLARPDQLDAGEVLHMARHFAAAAGIPAIMPHSRRYRFPDRNGTVLPPTVVAWGTKDRLLIGGQAARARALLPTAAHTRIPGGGHLLMLDDRAAVAALTLAV